MISISLPEPVKTAVILLSVASFCKVLMSFVEPVTVQFQTALSESTLKEFLGNLNMLHERITHIMPDLQPPKFSIKEIENNHVELTYESDREGLAPMAVSYTHLTLPTTPYV